MKWNILFFQHTEKVINLDFTGTIEELKRNLNYLYITFFEKNDFGLQIYVTDEFDSEATIFNNYIIEIKYIEFQFTK